MTGDFGASRGDGGLGSAHVAHDEHGVAARLTEAAAACHRRRVTRGPHFDRRRTGRQALAGIGDRDGDFVDAQRERSREASPVSSGRHDAVKRERPVHGPEHVHFIAFAIGDSRRKGGLATCRAR